MKKLLLFFVALFMTGCAAMPRMTVNSSFALYRSYINIYNNAGPAVTIQPFSRGEEFITEYRLGKRSPWCLWLCHEKIPTKIAVLEHGEHLAIPLLMNLTGQYRRESIGLLIRENGRKVGTYTYCVEVPPNRDIAVDLPFGPNELRSLKNGHPGRPCNGGGWW